MDISTVFLCIVRPSFAHVESGQHYEIFAHILNLLDL